jgi:hypothetical protein
MAFGMVLIHFITSIIMFDTFILLSGLTAYKPARPPAPARPVVFKRSVPSLGGLARFHRAGYGTPPGPLSELARETILSKATPIFGSFYFINAAGFLFQIRVLAIVGKYEWPLLICTQDGLGYDGFQHGLGQNSLSQNGHRLA